MSEFLHQKASLKCWNCPTYMWKNMDDEKLSPCSQCRWALYCSKECQKEHWKKVHKQHCKYLAGKEINPMSRHVKASCPKCKVKKKDANHVDNPAYPCHLEVSYGGKLEGYKETLPYQLPCVGKEIKDIPMVMPFGELTGKYISNIDKNISILQQLFMKIRNIYPRAFNGAQCKKALLIHESLTIMRASIMSNSLRFYTVEEIDSSCDGFDILNIELKITNEMVTSVLEFHQSIFRHEKRHGVYRWWTAFIFYLSLLFQGRFYAKTLFYFQCFSSEILDEFDLEGPWNTNFQPIWERLLNAVVDKMVPFDDLLSICCDGQLERECGSCYRRIKVATFDPSPLALEMDDSWDGFQDFYEYFTGGQAFVSFGNKLRFCCERLQCKYYINLAFVKCRNSDPQHKFTWKYSVNKCDNCYKIKETAHRCSGCKTKVYCSEECQHQDWRIHKLCCKDLAVSEEQQLRKKKANNCVRKQLGAERLDAISSVKNPTCDEMEKLYIDRKL